MSERRTTEQQTWLLNLALDRVSEGIFLMEEGSPCFTYVNQSAADYLGYTRAELTGGMSVFDIDPDWTPERWKTYLPEIRVRRRMTFETAHRTRDGRLIPVEVTSSWFEHEGRAYNMALTRDISERHAAEQALRASEAAYRSLVENTPDHIVRWDRSLHRVLVNQGFARWLGKPAAQLVGGPFGKGHRPESAQPLGRIEQAIRRVFETEVAELLVMPLTGQEGERTIQLRLIPERDAHGVVATVLGIGRDISEIKETERQLRTLTEHSPDVIIRFDREGRYLYANETLARLTGVPVSAHLGREFGSVSGPASAARYAALRRKVGEVFTSRAPAEFELSLPVADREHDFNVRLVPEEDDHGNTVSVLAVVRDITGKKQAEAALRASEERFRQVTENVDEVFWLTDVAKTEMLYLSPAYERVFAQPIAAVLADPRAWLERVVPEDRERVAASVTRQAAGGYDIEYRIARPDGQRWIHERAFPITDGTGTVYRIAGVAEDVTVRRQLEDQLRQAVKMEAVGRLAGGIAHDFNNMLAVIQMQSTLLEEEGDLAPAVRDGLREILAATERATNLTRQLLTFSRRQVYQPVALDIGEVVGNMTRMLRRLLGEDILLETRFAPALPPILADPGMMEQVLMNLAINARDAMPGGGRLAIALEPTSRQRDPALAERGTAPQDQRYVCLTVSDTGCGIAPEALPRIFEPFFTTKEVGQGTGLGLATVFGIVEQHHGWIEVDSAVGAGTTFRVFLPAAQAGGAAPGASPGGVEASPRGHETVLLVEDETAVRSSSRSALTRLGYEVLEAESAEQALAVWETEASRIALLVTDLVMPGGMSGRQLAAKLLARRPALPVLYITGYSPDLVEETFGADHRVQVLQKPFGAAALAVAVRRTLDRR
ncbi:MAG TPA: PAS domain S-box protein [Gemmatimonadales bacterium]|nr:PAS domain S-box protein [Gemmatimonadales bacterium]